MNITYTIPMGTPETRQARKQVLFALVDEEDFQRLALFNWTAEKTNRRNHETGEIVETYRAIRESKGLRIDMHYAVLKLEPSPQTKVKHRNGNALDNRKSNLIVESV